MCHDGAQGIQDQLCSPWLSSSWQTPEIELNRKLLTLVGFYFQKYDSIDLELGSFGEGDLGR